MIFFLFRLLPGDPTIAMLDPLLPISAREAVLERFGLDKPLSAQYFIFIKQLATGDFGISFRYKIPVMPLLGEKTLNTAILALLIFVLSHLIAIPVGVYLAWHRGERIEIIGNVIALWLRSMPMFWVAMVMIMFFSFVLNILPVGGILTPGYRIEGLIDKYFSVEFIKHLILPVLVGVIHHTGFPLLLVRNTMLDVMDEDFIEIARAKGLSEIGIMFKHAARNALLPVVTAGAFFIGRSLGGLVLIEFVFSWPGLGREIVNAINGRDYPVAQGAFILIATIVIVLNILTDLIYPYLDPRIEET